MQRRHCTCSSTSGACCLQQPSVGLQHHHRHSYHMLQTSTPYKVTATRCRQFGLLSICCVPVLSVLRVPISAGAPWQGGPSEDSLQCAHPQPVGRRHSLCSRPDTNCQVRPHHLQICRVPEWPETRFWRVPAQECWRLGWSDGPICLAAAAGFVLGQCWDCESRSSLLCNTGCNLSGVMRMKQLAC